MSKLVKKLGPEREKEPVVRFEGGLPEQCTHARRDGVTEVQRLLRHREEMLAVLHGRRPFDV